MNQSTNRPFALGGLITDTGCDADHPPRGLDFSCTQYIPERDGTLVDAEQTKKWRPLLEAINRGPDGDVGAHAVFGLPPVRKLTAYGIVPKELLEPTQPSAEEIARYRLETQQLHAREDARHAQFLAAGGVVAAIAGLHSPEGDRECAGCDGATEYPPAWPCRTWELLDETVPR